MTSWGVTVEIIDIAKLTKENFQSELKYIKEDLIIATEKNKKTFLQIVYSGESYIEDNKTTIPCTNGNLAIEKVLNVFNSGDVDCYIWLVLNCDRDQIAVEEEILSGPRQPATALINESQSFHDKVLERV